jgi:hypothetical protein
VTGQGLARPVLGAGRSLKRQHHPAAEWRYGLLSVADDVIRYGRRPVFL